VSYRWVEHTAELELEIDAATEERVFVDALAAMCELLDEEGTGGEPLLVELSLAGWERALLLADWLDELVYRADTEGLIPASVERIELQDDGLSATIRAVRGAPRPIVKVVTRHRLEFEPTTDGFRATVVLDV
jgi:SHS2 domain-containing protein